MGGLGGKMLHAGTWGHANCVPPGFPAARAHPLSSVTPRFSRSTRICSCTSAGRQCGVAIFFFLIIFMEISLCSQENI